MELAEIRERILNTPLAQKLTEDMRARFAMMLLSISQTEEVSREQTLFKQGEKNEGTGCLILEGMVRIITETEDSKTIEAPDILGEVQLFTPEGTRTATVEVVVGGKILTFQWSDLAALAKQYYSAEEMETFRQVISDSAWTREQYLKERLGLA